MTRYYCEIGANDGVTQARSLHLDTNPDYVGLLIEPDLESYNKLLNNRANKNLFFNIACSSFEDGEHISDFFNNGLMSGLPGSYDYAHSAGRTSKVSVKPLQVILDSFHIEELEHLFLDVEGKEIDVLKGIDYNKTIISNIEVEIHYPSHESIIKDLLTENGFVLIEEITGDGLPKLNFKRDI